jgi:hypothetical protein
VHLKAVHFSFLCFAFGDHICLPIVKIIQLIGGHIRYVSPYFMCLQIAGSVAPPGGLPGAGTVELMVQFSKGFIAAESGGSIAIYEKVDEENFKRIRSFKVDMNGTRMASFTLSPNEDVIIGVLETRQLLVIPFLNSEFYKADEIPKEMTVHVSRDLPT